MTLRDEVIREEDAAWLEFWPVVSSLSRDLMERDGYYEEWSVKDLLAHIGSWQAEAAVMLEQVRMGTYSKWAGDVDAVNREWWEIWRGQDAGAVLAHLHSSRARMLDEWSRLPEDRLQGAAVEWLRESGVQHYREHLERLREWASELTGG
jgi:hypothetical protein